MRFVSSIGLGIIDAILKMVSRHLDRWLGLEKARASEEARDHAYAELRRMKVYANGHDPDGLGTHP